MKKIKEMKEQTYRKAMLFDFYGEVLTERQKEFYDLYYHADLSLAEIAANYGISRQGVRDVIVRAEAALTELEEKTGMIRRFHKMQEQMQEMQKTLDQIGCYNHERYQDEKIAYWVNQAEDMLDQLMQE